jgi:NAD(P)-dependent dehydrogenase (short-subunit alcohol dehydrogenase family)
MSRFDGQISVVTGASSGIGRAIALELASRGARVWLVARRGDVLEEVAELARRAGAHVFVRATDLCDDTQVTHLCEQIHKECGGVDVLVHCAGAYARGSIGLAPVTQFDAQYRANVRSPYLLTQLLLPLLRERRGQVAFVNSSAVLHARPGVGQFAATQHALRALADTLRQEVNADGIRVLSVYPGRTATPRQAAIYADEGRPYHPERLIRPEDVALALVQALATERSAEITDLFLRSMQSP